MSESLRILIDCSSSPKPIITCCSVLPPEIVMHDAYIGGHFQRKKITCKASDTAENLQLYRVVRFFRPRSSCTTHISVDIQRMRPHAWRSRAEEPKSLI